MNHDTLSQLSVLGIAMVIAFCVGAFVGEIRVVGKIDRELVSRGYKFYDSKTGELKWKEQWDGQEAKN